MDSIPATFRVIVDWLIMLFGTLFTFLEKKEDTEATEEA